MMKTENRDIESALDGMTELEGATYLLELFTTKKIDFDTYAKYMKVVNDRAERVEKYGVK